MKIAQNALVILYLSLAAIASARSAELQIAAKDYVEATIDRIVYKANLPAPFNSISLVVAWRANGSNETKVEAMELISSIGHVNLEHPMLQEMILSDQPEFAYRPREGSGQDIAEAAVILFEIGEPYAMEYTTNCRKDCNDVVRDILKIVVSDGGAVEFQTIRIEELF